MLERKRADTGVVEFIRLLALQIPLLLFKAIKSSIVHIIIFYFFYNKCFVSLSLLKRSLLGDA